jgi:hypothetical protein
VATASALVQGTRQRLVPNQPLTVVHNVYVYIALRDPSHCCDCFLPSKDPLFIIYSKDHSLLSSPLLSASLYSPSYQICLMPASPNASPNSVHPTFDSHSILAQFEASHHPEAFVGQADLVEDQQPETTQHHGTIRNPEVPVNELGIYEASAYTEDCLSPLEAFSETTEPLATHVPEKSLHQDPPGHVRSPILSK